MKQTNLLSFIQGYNHLEKSLFKDYVRYYSIEIKDSELKDLNIMMNELESITSKIRLYDNFTIGYTIPQIGKEFDLLQFGKDSIINIELKRTSTPEKIIKQLKRNRYYLSFLGKGIFQTTFVSNENAFYSLGDDDSLITLYTDDIIKALRKQKSEEILNLNELFEPSNYLVSPFNSTDKFISDSYFLTQQQEIIKKSILSILSSKKAVFVSIIGEAGTGKTLLTYDIAKGFINANKKVLIIHCANLNQGQTELVEKHEWDILPAKRTKSVKLSKYDLVILDEVQRMYPGQLSYVIKKTKEFSGNCLFSYDQEQCLSNLEINYKNEQRIATYAEPKVFKLTKTIRTNKQIAIFIRAFLNKNVSVPKIQDGNIEVKYFKKYNYAKFFIEHLCKEGWEMINYTPDRNITYNYEKFSQSSSSNAHGVIGQEFEKVIAVLDYHFHYVDNKLSIRGYKGAPYYNPLKMLEQIMTRTRGKLYVIVINNNEVIKRCLDILNG